MRSRTWKGLRTTHSLGVYTLTRLRQAGLRLVALTNSTAQVAEAQLAHAGLSGSFEHIFSADAVQRLKPAPEPYQMVADRLGWTPAISD